MMKNRNEVVFFCVSAIAISLVSIASQVDAADGRDIYEQNCKSCHDTGVGGAPRLNDKQEWAQRLEKGIAGLWIRLNSEDGISVKITAARSSFHRSSYQLK